jgi:hypothetical protein
MNRLRWHRPFREGHHVELVTMNGRLVRGYVLAAGRGLIQLNIGTGQAVRVALVRYQDFARWRFAEQGPNGSWSTVHPSRPVMPEAGWIEVG